MWQQTRTLWIHNFFCMSNTKRKKKSTNSVPDLHLSLQHSARKNVKVGKMQYYSNKMGVKYKSNISDFERWQQYRNNESFWASNGSFRCPYQFLGGVDDDSDDSDVCFFFKI